MRALCSMGMEPWRNIDSPRQADQQTDECWIDTHIWRRNNPMGNAGWHQRFAVGVTSGTQQTSEVAQIMAGAEGPTDRHRGEPVGGIEGSS